MDDIREKGGTRAGNDEGQDGYERVNDEEVHEVEMKRMNLVYHVPYVTLMSK